MAKRTPGRQYTKRVASPWADDTKEHAPEKEFTPGKSKKPIRREKEFKGTDKPITTGLRFDQTDPLAARQARRAAEGKHFIAPVADELKPKKGMKRLRGNAAGSRSLGSKFPDRDKPRKSFKERGASAPRAQDQAASAEQIRELPKATGERSAMRERMAARKTGEHADSPQPMERRGTIRRSLDSDKLRAAKEKVAAVKSRARESSGETVRPTAQSRFAEGTPRTRRTDAETPRTERAPQAAREPRVATNTFERAERMPTLKERREYARNLDTTIEKPKKNKEGRKYDRPSTIPGDRVQKIIANAGLASRREAEKWIEEGRVQVNGVTIKLGDKALPGDKITVNGAPVQTTKHSYYMLHKPKDFVTTRDDKIHKQRTVMELIPVEERIYPIGRLDKDTTGILIFTSDGDFANKLMHPRYEIEKTYIATLDKPFDPAKVAVLEKGIRLKEGIVRSKVRILSTRKVEITLHQGFNHVVKRLMKEVGFWVTDLERIKVGPLALDIPLGAYRPLSAQEVSLFSKPRNQQGNLPRGH